MGVVDIIGAQIYTKTTKHACRLRRVPTGAALCGILFEMLWPNPWIYSLYAPFLILHRRQCKAQVGQLSWTYVMML